MHVGEERAFQGAGDVALEPEVALEGFQVGDLEVLRGEVVDVGEEGGGRGGVFGGEGRAVGGEGGGVPFGSEGGREGGEGVGELEEEEEG